jgi:hypothetical protein
MVSKFAEFEPRIRTVTAKFSPDDSLQYEIMGALCAINRMIPKIKGITVKRDCSCATWATLDRNGLAKGQLRGMNRLFRHIVRSFHGLANPVKFKFIADGITQHYPEFFRRCTRQLFRNLDYDNTDVRFEVTLWITLETEDERKTYLKEVIDSIARVYHVINVKVKPRLIESIEIARKMNAYAAGVVEVVRQERLDFDE